MSFDAPEHTLASLCLLVVDCPHSTPVWTNNGVVVLRNQNIKKGRLDLSSPSFTDEAHYLSRIKRAAPTAGDIVITREAPMGEVCEIPTGLRCCLGQRQVLLRPDRTKVDGRFLLFALQSAHVQHQIGWNEGTGSTVSNLRIPVLEALNIPTPPLAVQREVAQLLGGLDDRIALLHEANATLEAVAQTLFKSWFVDFDPVRAKAEGREPEGLDPATAALFVDGFEESELGLIPKGWQIARIEDIAEKIGMGPFGSNIKVSTFVDEGVPVLSGKHVQHTLLEDQASSYITEAHAERLKNSSVSSGDVVITHRGTLGQVSLIPENSKHRKYMLSQSQFFLRCDTSKMTPEWITYFLRSPLGQHLLLANASQVGVPSIARPTSYLRSIKFVLPSLNILNRFSVVTASLHETVIANRNRIETLSSIRDTLLPRLISGQLRLPEIEAMLEAAA